MTETARILVACLRRDFQISRNYGFGYLLQFAAGAASLCLVYYVSKLFLPASNTGPELSDGYFAFIVAGLAAARILEALLVGIPARVRQDQLTGALEAVFATPANPVVVAFGYGLFDLLRAVIDAMLFLVVAVAVFGLSLDSSPETLLAGAAGFGAVILMGAAAGVVCAAVVIAFARAHLAVGLVSGIVAFTGTVFFPASVLPQPLEALATVNPLSWALALLRPLTTDAPIPWDRFALIVGFLAVLIPAVPWLVGRCLDLARRRGTVGQY